MDLDPPTLALVIGTAVGLVVTLLGLTFLGMPEHQVQTVAKQTLEGVLREVLSQLTPEEVNEDRLKFAETLMRNAKDDFDKLGLELDVLKVQHVADDQKYLANLGRAQIA